MTPTPESPADIPPPPPIPLRRRLAGLAAGILGLALLGWIDYRTGYELGFFVFYSLPVGFTAWYGGLWPGVITALGSSLTWWLADHLNGVNNSNRFYLWWNLSVHFVAFVINAVTLAKIKLAVDERRALVDELRRLQKILRGQAAPPR